MKIDKQFLPIYDTVFAWILENEGLDNLVKFWKYLAKFIVADLQQGAKVKGIQGCYDYWNKVLTEEGAKFKLSIEPATDKLSLEIKQCPSIQHLNVPQCPEYCRHCKIIYAEILEPLGFKYTHLQKGQGRCEITVEKVDKIERKQNEVNR